MYILSVDLGSSKSKAIIMQIKESANGGDIEFTGKVKMNNIDFALFISSIIKKFSIKPKDIEVIVATGTGSSYIDNIFKYHDETDGVDVDIKIIKVDEFDAIGYGGLILSKNTEGIVVSIGTGTTIIYSDLDKNIRLGGTGLGGGTLVGLGNALIKLSGSEIAKENRLITFSELIDIARKGDYKNVNLTISDINNGDIGKLTGDVTAANFAGVNKKANTYDCIAGIVNLIVENICLLVHSLLDSITLKELKKSKEVLPIIFIGTMTNNDYVHSCIETVGKYTCDKYTFIKDADIATAIGAYEYYLIRLRKNY